MAFDYTNLYPDTSGNGGYTKTWNYTTLDPISTVTAAGYFNIVASRLGIGDNIFVSRVDAFATKARTALVERSSLFVTAISGGVVTVTASSDAGTLQVANNLSDVSNTATARTNLGVATHTIEVTIDGGSVALTTGIKGYLEVPFDLTLTQATLLADRSGSVVVDIFKCTYAQFDASTHPVAGDKITASAPPTITTATKSQDASLTGWTTAVTAGSILGFNINSATTIRRITLSLKYTR